MQYNTVYPAWILPGCKVCLQESQVLQQDPRPSQFPFHQKRVISALIALSSI